jgi:hypothetical protein
MYQARPVRSATRVLTQGMPWIRANDAWKSSMPVARFMARNCSSTAVLSMLASR